MLICRESTLRIRFFGIFSIYNLKGASIMNTVTIAPIVFTSFILAAAAEIVLPIVLMLILCLKKILSPKPMFFGILAFFVSQICLRIPILQALSMQSWFKAFAMNTIPYLIVLSFTAGLFEESARYLCAGCFLKKNRLFQDALSFGLGHGFCEVILLTGMAQINNITYAVMINNGSFNKVMANVPAAASQQILNAMLSAKPELVYLGVLERVFAVAFHVFASVLIFKAVNEHKVLYYFYALAAHFATDFGTTAISKFTGNVWVTEGFLFVVAIVSVLLIFKIKPTFPEQKEKTVLIR